MTDAPRQPPREVAADALRALALLPVVAVNWVGYAALPDTGPLAAARPVDSSWAQGWLIAVATLLAAKGITLLMFLFGYGQGLSRRARGPQALAVRGRRMRRLLLLGLLHGALIYAGDILTLYALCGLVMLRWSGLPLGQLWRRARWLMGAGLVLLVLAAPLILYGAPDEPVVVARSLATPLPLLSWWALNAGGFLQSLLALLLLGFLLPLGVMTAGLVAARLRLFSHRRWRPLLQRWVRCWMLPGLALNFAWALALWYGLHRASPGWSDVIYAFGNCVAVPLLVGVGAWVTLAAQHAAPWVARCAQGGRHTLSLYLGSSALSLLLFSGVGLALPWGTAAVAALAVLYWSLWMVGAPRGRLPLESWLSR